MRIIILTDGIRGHYHQSLGIARWLERLGDSKIIKEIAVPELQGIKRFINLKIKAKRLINNKTNYSDKYLNEFNFKINTNDFNNNDILFISTGSSAAPFNLAFSRSTRNKSVVIMTPSILGTEPFDFAIIPEHDKHKQSKNILTTIGAPNHIYIPDLKNQAEKKFPDLKLINKKIISILIGGDDANYRISPEWIKDNLSQLKNIRDSVFLITTSRRTSKESEKIIKEIFEKNESTKYLLLSSENPEENPIPAMLGISTHVLVTEDSVSMVSEAATAGFRVGLMRVERKTGFLKNLTGFGASRFDNLFLKMRNKKLIYDLGEKGNNLNNLNDLNVFLSVNEQKHGEKFNEAERAAKWIYKHL